MRTEGLSGVSTVLIHPPKPHLLLSHFKQAQEDSARAIKKTKQEKQNWQSQGRKDIIAAEEVARKEYERVQLEERRIKSEQARTVKEWWP
jgi:hypothetical protein